MVNLIELADGLKSLDEKLAKCMKCGTCQSVCPIFAETLREGDVARGKLSLLADLSQSILADTKGVREKLDRCLLCGSCRAACPSGVDILQIFLSAREICARIMGMPKIKKIIFKLILTNPKFFGFAAAAGLPLAKLFFLREKNAPDTVFSPLLTPLAGKRHIPTTPQKTFSAKYGCLRIPAKTAMPTVLFFTGCMGDKLYVRVSEACVKIFKHYGVGVIIPENLPCCGMPALASGATEEFDAMMRRNLEIFKREKFDYVVTACASCTETIARFWPARAKGGDLEEFAVQTAKKTRDISEFLIDTLKVGTAASKDEDDCARTIAVTYHDSCHLAKALGIRRQPRELIALSKEYRLAEMPESDRCCGCGGSFTLTHHALSKKIGERKRANIVKSGAQIVAAGCPACMMQLSDVLAENGDRIAVRHVAEIFAESLYTKPHDKPQ